MINLSRKYGIAMNSDVLRMARANFLYDTMAARLDPQIDAEKVYRDQADLKFPHLFEKWVFAATVAIRFAILSGALTAAAAALIVAPGLWAGERVDVASAVGQVLANNWFQLLLLVLVVVDARKVRFRMNDKRTD